MAARLVAELPEGPDWQYELKLDGFRCLAIRIGPSIRLYSRNQNELTTTFPGIAADLNSVPGNWVLDGEVVALDERGHPTFSGLQNRRTFRGPILMYVFDLLHLNGRDLHDRPLLKRRESLASLLSKTSGSTVRLSPHLDGDVSAIVKAVTQLGLEGVVAKKTNSRYIPGDRKGDWLKYRVGLSQEFVVGGYRPSTRHFESLLVGYYEKDKLLYAGAVRAGFQSLSKGHIAPLLKAHRQEACPFSNLPERRHGRWGEGITKEDMAEFRWVRPQLIVQVKFVSWADDGHLRHASYVGVRDDKTPRQVVRER